LNPLDSPLNDLVRTAICVYWRQLDFRPRQSSLNYSSRTISHCYRVDHINKFKLCQARLVLVLVTFGGSAIRLFIQAIPGPLSLAIPP